MMSFSFLQTATKITGKAFHLVLFFPKSAIRNPNYRLTHLHENEPQRRKERQGSQGMPLCVSLRPWCLCGEERNLRHSIFRSSFRDPLSEIFLTDLLTFLTSHLLAFQFSQKATLQHLRHAQWSSSAANPNYSCSRSTQFSIFSPGTRANSF